MGKFSLHVEKWKKGCGSECCGKAKNVVYGRGTLPCDMLFIGEAPGESEDVVGRPFVGPAGKLLDKMIGQALGGTVTFAITNMVGCIPRDDDGNKAVEPGDDQIKACGPRLLDFISLAKPKVIVCVGKVAAEWTDPAYKHSVKVGGVARVEITHPAAILRANVVQRGLMIQRNVVILRNAVEDLK